MICSLTFSDLTHILRLVISVEISGQYLQNSSEGPLTRSQKSGIIHLDKSSMFSSCFQSMDCPNATFCCARMMTFCADLQWLALLEFSFSEDLS
jgi:hypothetical protein